MANQDPKTGRMLSKFARLAKEHALAAAQVGQNMTDKDVTALEFRINDETEGVQSYARQMLTAVREAGDNMGALRQASGVVDEINRLAQMEDPTLTKAEKRRLSSYASDFHAVCRIKANIFRQSARKIGSVVRTSTSRARESVAGALAGSGSSIFGLAAKAIAPRERKDTTQAQKSVLQNKSEMFQNVADRQQALLNQPDESRTLKPGALDADEDLSPRRKRGEGTGSGTGHPAPIFEAMLSELTAIYTLLKKREDRAEQSHEQAERDADNSPKRIIEKSGAGGKADKKKPGGILDILGSLFPGLGKAVATVVELFAGATGIAAIVSTVIMPALSVLGPALAVVGAAFAGWKIGQMIDKWTGASNLVESAAKSVSEHLLGTKNERVETSEAQQEVINTARRHAAAEGVKNSATTIRTYQDALKFNEGWGARRQAAVAPKLVPGVGATPPAQVPNITLSSQVPGVGTKLPTPQAPRPRSAASIPKLAVSPLKVLPGSKVGPLSAPIAPKVAPTRIPTGSLADIKGYNKSSDSYKNALREAAMTTGVSEETLAIFGQIESSSGTRVDAARSSAKGPFQFIETTWMETLRKHGPEFGIDLSRPKQELLNLRYDNRIAALMAALFTKDNANKLKLNPNDPQNTDELYLAHFLGVGNAQRVLSGQDIVNREAVVKANPQLGTGSNAEILKFNSKKVSGVRAASPMITATNAHRDATTVINAPTTVIAGNGTGRGQSNGNVAMPIAVRPDNPDASIRAFSSLNGN